MADPFEEALTLFAKFVRMNPTIQDDALLVRVFRAYLVSVLATVPPMDPQPVDDAPADYALVTRNGDG